MSAESDGQVGFIDEQLINDLLEAGKTAGKSRGLEIVAKARECNGLELDV